MKEREQGFFLLETILLAGMLVLMTSGLWIYRQGLYLCEQTRFEAAAVSLAESELAYLSYAAAQNENFSAGSSERWEYVPFSTRSAEGGGNFLIQEEVRQLAQASGLDAAAMGNVYLAEVRVCWQDRKNRERGVSLQKVICP